MIHFVVLWCFLRNYSIETSISTTFSNSVVATLGEGEEMDVHADTRRPVPWQVSGASLVYGVLLASSCFAGELWRCFCPPARGHPFAPRDDIAPSSRCGTARLLSYSSGGLAETGSFFGSVSGYLKLHLVIRERLDLSPPSSRR